MTSSLINNYNKLNHKMQNNRHNCESEPLTGLNPEIEEINELN